MALKPPQDSFKEPGPGVQAQRHSPESLDYINALHRWVVCRVAHHSQKEERDYRSLMGEQYWYLFRPLQQF